MSSYVHDDPDDCDYPNPASPARLADVAVVVEPTVAPPAMFSTEAIVAPMADPTIVDAKVVHNETEMWGDLLKYQVSCCGLRLGLLQAKRLLIAMGVLVGFMCVCVIVAAFAMGEQQSQPTEQGLAASCNPNPCNNGGACFLLEDTRFGFECACTDGFLGVDCGIDTHACRSSPCQHNGTCVDSINTFHCMCLMGFTGDNCEEDLLDMQMRACETLVCHNGGHCRTEGLSGSVFCACAPGFAGSNCQMPEDSLEPTAEGGGLTTDIGFGNGVDISEAFNTDGSLNLKFAPLFSRNNGMQPMVQSLDRIEPVSTEFYEEYGDFVRTMVSSLAIHPFHNGMLSADPWVADIRRHSFTDSSGLVFGISRKRVVVEEKTYPACTPQYAGFGHCLELHSAFLAAVDDLPTAMVAPEDTQAYFNFLVTYGTHYVKKEFYGGFLQAEYFVAPDNATTVAELEMLTNEVFEGIVSGNMRNYISGSETELHERVPHITRAEFFSVGGHLVDGHMIDGDFSEWATLVKNFTELVGAELESIARLAPTPAQQARISQAIDAFLTQCLPDGAGPNDPICGNRGECRTLWGDNQCICDPGFYGTVCQHRSCPSLHPTEECSGHGSCDSFTGFCTCSLNTTTQLQRWTGPSCSHDIDECSHDGNSCATHHRECINTPGGYHCPANCLEGWAMDANGVCLDVDECAAEQDPCIDISDGANEIGACRNVAGTFQCVVCPVGHDVHDSSGDCVDINECNEPGNECAANLRECINHAGAFSCGDCIPGYEMGPENGFCVDIDECVGLDVVEVAQLCGGENRICENFDGGHSCNCAPSFEEQPDGSCLFHPASCPPYTPQHAQGGFVACTGESGDGCVVDCATGYVSTGPAVCTSAGVWADGLCLFECPTVELHGDCAEIGNQNYNVQESLMNGKPHYISENEDLHMYFDGQVWLIDDDLDSNMIHAHLRSNNIFPTGRQMWVVWCGAYYGWSEMVLDIECSGLCADTCVGASNGVCDDGGHDALTQSLCAYGSDCDDCGVRLDNDRNACYETMDWDGNTCYQYHNIGYTCTDLVHVYGRDCACTCPEMYLQGVDNMELNDVYECPCPADCSWQVTSYQGDDMVCECHGCGAAGRRLSQALPSLPTAVRPPMPVERSRSIVH